MSALVISLDFELFWGVTDTKSIDNYGANVEGVWQAIPAMLKIFKQYEVHVTWATVGMLMCKDYQHWCDLQPTHMPTYSEARYSTYTYAEMAREYPKLFFASPLVEQILATDHQELASHTHSHFYCSDSQVTLEQFKNDLDCTQTIFNEYGVKPTSLVFPRNQVGLGYLSTLSDAGYTAYRGNQDHWIYRDGHTVPYGKVGRLARFTDAYLPLTGQHVSPMPTDALDNKLINIPASHFLRPISGYSLLDNAHLSRIKGGMLAAAKTGGIFHLWWHPHNFGVNLSQNLTALASLLQYFLVLQDQHGMRSMTMAAIANLAHSTDKDG